MNVERIESELLNTIKKALSKSNTNIKYTDYKFTKLNSISLNNTKINIQNYNIIMPNNYEAMTNILASIQTKFISDLENECGCSHIDALSIYKELVEDPEIGKMLFAGTYVNSILNENKIDFKIDYSFAIMNNVKAVEKYLVVYLKKVKNKYSLQPDINNNIYETIYNKKWYDAVTLDNLIKYLNQNKKILFKNYQSNQLLESLDFFKRNMRNGYFHKHIIEDIHMVKQINFKCIVLLVQLILNLNK